MGKGGMLTAEVQGWMSGRNQGSAGRKRPVSQSWHGFATLGLQRHFCDARQE